MSSEARSGVRQGCPLGPILWNILLEYTLRAWWAEATNIPPVGLHTKVHGALRRNFAMADFVFAEHTVGTLHARDLDFADDIAIMALSLGDLAEAVECLQVILSDWGFRVSKKAQLLVLCAHAGAAPPEIDLTHCEPGLIVKEADGQAAGGAMVGKGNFKYLGQTKSNANGAMREIKVRMRRGRKAF